MVYECQDCGKKWEDDILCKYCLSDDIISYDSKWDELKKRLEWMITDKNGNVNRESGEGIRIAMVLDIMESLEKQ